MSDTFMDQAVEGNRLVDHQIKSYNDFVENRLQKILNEVGEVEPELPGGEELVIKLGDVEVEEPMMKEADGSMTHLTPAEARRRDLTYSSRIRVTMTPIFEGRRQEPEIVTIGKIPVMVGSSLCPTSDMDREELIENDEDPEDTGGYFIINGTEKVLVSMEEM
ncbi:MAG: DNA-directed RNA polymerase subunit B'', partial [Candidatus Nanohaloarchaea archaeon]|nr:DNA-directed RNA polymerase subunit B'' [Candidatus Nanohaloarchaea archaeon]